MSETAVATQSDLNLLLGYYQKMLELAIVRAQGAGTLPQRAAARLRPPLCRRGSGGGGRLFESRASRLGFQHPSRPWSRSCQGSARSGRVGRTLGKNDRKLRRTRRQHAHVRARVGIHGDKRNRRRSHSSGDGRGSERQDEGQGPGRGLLLWRRRGKQRIVSRSCQYGRGVESARHLRL